MGIVITAENSKWNVGLLVKILTDGDIVRLLEHGNLNEEDAKIALAELERREYPSMSWIANAYNKGW